ncbi:hypothetical protein, variant 1 [Verruconis gallopava]|uniref:C2H2-type domain-containing protein n=1 Tax=Verruconis gallopava TaxID=253628 RepID=A0A0D2AXW3_9PEZI|nr:hypothetical protein, variant 1 [Verruconis gallopava]KIW03979.1 hypothetical protein, variant 1 [Verruconis gallopava]
MAMAVDSRNQQSHLNLPGYDGLRYQHVPQFTNPWSAATSAPQSHMYAPSSVAPSSGLDASQQAQRPTTLPMPAYGVPVTASTVPGAGSTPSGPFYDVQNGIDMSQDLLNAPRSYGAQYSTAGASTSYAQTSAPGYPMDYASSKSPAAYQQSFERRSSHPLNTQTTAAQRTSFSDAVDASRGMVSLSQSDITPRNIYDVRNASRSSTDSYGFPSTHSSHSSISSASTYPSSYGYNPSVAGSDISDYSSASESVDVNSRTLPRPTNFPGTAPPPQSMMGQFSSKVSSSSQKKHKCKICDKRFTRPSSLQTHMYSHTGEKPFACDVEGCGRHFSVVSNLRRHRKVHKGEGRDHPSPEDS